MAVTIRQIAAVAGVSRGTVDRVLHGRSGVKPEVAEHVRQIARDLGFEPNLAGKILASRKQPLKIGCFFPGVGNPFYDDVVAGVRRAGGEYADFGVVLEIREVMGYAEEEHIAAVRGLAEECAALCVSTVDTPGMRACVDELSERGVPVVAVNTDLTGTKRLCYVGCDYRAGGRTAAGLLARMVNAPVKLLIITGSERIKEHNERIAGFCETFRARGVAYELVGVAESQDSDLCAYEKTLAAFRARSDIDCVYIAAAGVAGVCRAVRELGLAGRVRVACHDDIAATRDCLREGIIDFTVCQGPEAQGYHSVRLLFEYFMSDRRQAPRDYITETAIKIAENL